MSAIIALPTEHVWEEMSQETMRHASKTVPASGDHEAPDVSLNRKNSDEGKVDAILERVKAKQKTVKPRQSSTSTVSTPLENVGPNTYERIRSNAGKTYQAQAVNYDGVDDCDHGLHKSA